MFLKRVKKLALEASIPLAIFFGLSWSFSGTQALSNSDFTPPRTPQGLKMEISGSHVNLSWKPNSEWNIFTYKIHLKVLNSTGEEKKKETIFTGKATNYKLDNLESNLAYYISLSAQDNSGNESNSTKEIGLIPNKNLINQELVMGADFILGPQKRDYNFMAYNIVSPAWYEISSDSALFKKEGASDPHLINSALWSNTKIVPTITNINKERIDFILKDKDLTEKLINNIYYEIITKKLDGINVDCGSLTQINKELFNDFLIKLAKKLHAKDKLIIITVRFSQFFSEPSADEYLDLKTLEQKIDYLKVFANNLYPDVPGPMLAQDQLQKTIDYLKARMPKEKILIVFPFFGYNWSLDGNPSIKKLLTVGEVQEIISRYQPKMEWDARAKEPWFAYLDEDKKTNIIYFQTASSLTEDLNLARKYGISAIAIQFLGKEDANTLDIIGRSLGTTESNFSNIQIQPKNNAIYLKWSKTSEADIFQIIYYKEGGNEKKITLENQTEIEIKDLENGQKYFITLIKLKDKKEIQRSRQIEVVPEDLYFPGTINDLTAESIDSTSVNLAWTTPGDDYFTGQAEKFEIRYSTEMITEDNFGIQKLYSFAPVPELAGSQQKWQLRDLVPGTQYFIAIKTLDKAGNKSEISNVVMAKTIDDIPPKIPQYFKITAGDGKVFLEWEPNQEKDLDYYNIYCRQGKSYYVIIPANKELTNYTLINLENNQPYYISLSAVDFNNNESQKTEEKEVFPRSENIYNTAKTSLIIFGKGIFNKNSLPYFIIILVVVVNFFFYQGIKEEIKRHNLDK